MFGEGKYDAECTAARELTGGSVLLMVIDGMKGNGFCAHVLPQLMGSIPQILRNMADQIDRDLQARKRGEPSEN